MEQAEVSFDVTAEEDALIGRVVERMEAATTDFDRMSVSMDLAAVHVNGCPLDFERLLAFGAFDFWHDVSGIVQHMDRSTGRLRDCFLPRCAR